jgi:hypothetical protein
LPCHLFVRLGELQTECTCAFAFGVIRKHAQSRCPLEIRTTLGFIQSRRAHVTVLVHESTVRLFNLNSLPRCAQLEQRHNPALARLPGAYKSLIFHRFHAPGAVVHLCCRTRHDPRVGRMRLGRSVSVYPHRLHVSHVRKCFHEALHPDSDPKPACKAQRRKCEQRDAIKASTAPGLLTRRPPFFRNGQSDHARL